MLGADKDAFLFEHLLQFAGLEHLADDVATADEFALDIKLRDRRPVREFLDALAHGRVGQYVDAFELDPHMAEDLHDGRGEAALRKDRRALHEEHDRRVGDLLADAVLYGNVHLGPRLKKGRSGGCGLWLHVWSIRPERSSAKRARAIRCPFGRARPG